MTGRRVLLVEDNKEIMNINMRLFKMENYEITAALTLADARSALGKSRPDVIVLDIMLPDGSGIDFIRELRSGENEGIPILLLTGLAAKEDILRGLKSGGDDYLTKPYDFDILLERVEALLRRAARLPEIIEKNGFSLDVTAGVAFFEGDDLLLTQKEFALLLVFIRHEDKVMSAEYLYERVWNKSMNNDAKAVQFQISNLRKKIDESGYTVTAKRNDGYVFERNA